MERIKGDQRNRKVTEGDGKTRHSAPRSEE